MPSLTVRIGRTTRNNLEHLAKSRGQTVSQFVRALIEESIACEGGPSDTDVCRPVAPASE